jgi:hypothetical protein
MHFNSNATNGIKQRLEEDISQGPRLETPWPHEGTKFMIITTRVSYPDYDKVAAFTFSFLNSAHGPNRSLFEV